MKINLFDKFKREFQGPANLNEPTYDFLNRSARPSIERVRNLLQIWFDRYPVEEKKELAARFKKDKEGGIDSAFHELYIHEYLLLNGFTPQVHPNLESTRNKPDFLAKQGSNKVCYIEAVTITGESEGEKKENRRRDQLVDIINRSGVKDFFFSIRFIKTKEQQLSANNVIAFLEEKSSTINPDELAESVSEDGIHKLPNWIYKDEGWEIEFSPIPIKPKSRKKKNLRPIGLYSSDFKFIDSKKSILSSLRKKAKKYGSFHEPFVIAANITDPFTELIDVIQALFGDVKSSDIDGITTLSSGDSFWGNCNRPKNQDVSAVILTFRLNPWTVSNTKMYLFVNPWANHPISQIFNNTTKYELLPTIHAYSSYVDSQSIFGLSKNWPKQG